MLNKNLKKKSATKDFLNKVWKGSPIVLAPALVAFVLMYVDTSKYSDTIEAQYTELEVKLESLEGDLTESKDMMVELKEKQETTEAKLEERSNKAQQRLDIIEDKDKEIESLKQQVVARQEQKRKEKELAQKQAIQEKQKSVAQVQHKPTEKTGSDSQQTVLASRGNSQSEPTASREFYVEATAYGPDCVGCSGITAYGINLHENPGIRLIAVDPNVIPLGSKVWVEGYGHAIAGDTGGDIKGNRIDLLYPSEAASNSWGRRTVKIKILN